jgi:hypothetical protein
MEDGDEGRRRLQGRRLILSQPRARGALLLTLADLFITFLFAVLPDNREAEGSQQEAIFVAQKVFAWFNFVISGVCVGVIWYTFGVPVASLNTERQLTLWYAIVLQLLQMLLDMALAGYPTGMRQLLVIVSLVLRVRTATFNPRRRARRGCTGRCADRCTPVARADGGGLLLPLPRAQGSAATAIHCQCPA